MSTKKITKKNKPAAAPKAKVNSECNALNVGHRSCTCPDCDHNAPKK